MQNFESECQRCEEAIREAIQEALEPENIFRPFAGQICPRFQYVRIGSFDISFHVCEIEALGGGQRVRLRRVLITCEEGLPPPHVAETVANLFGFSGPPEYWRSNILGRTVSHSNTVEFIEPMHETEHSSRSLMAMAEACGSEPPQAQR